MSHYYESSFWVIIKHHHYRSLFLSHELWLVNSKRQPSKVAHEATPPKAKKKKKKPSKKPNKPPKIVSRKVVIVDPDGNELSLDDALKYGYIDENNYKELKEQENEYDEEK